MFATVLVFCIARYDQPSSFFHSLLFIYWRVQGGVRLVGVWKNGSLDGDDIRFFYPDSSYLIGKWKVRRLKDYVLSCLLIFIHTCRYAQKGDMKSAVYVPLEDESLTEERINLEPKIPPKSATFKYEESSKTLAKVSLVADPYESRCVYVQKSAIAGEVRIDLQCKLQSDYSLAVEFVIERLSYPLNPGTVCS